MDDLDSIREWLKHVPDRVLAADRTVGCSTQLKS